MKKINVRYLWILLAFLPWSLSLNYMRTAWRTSPMDRQDWYFILIFMVLFPIMLKRKNEPTEKDGQNWVSYYALCSSIITMMAGIFVDINMLYIIGAQGFAWSICRFCVGKAKSKALLLPFIILSLSTTSSTYWISFVTGWAPTQAIWTKFLLATLLIPLSFLTFRFRCEPVMFIIATITLLLICFKTEVLVLHMPPLMPDFTISPQTKGHFVGREIPISEDMRRFFEDTDANLYVYANDRRTFQILNITCNDNIHKIHPTSHCLRGNGATIVSESPYLYEIHGQEILLQEIIATRRNQKELHVVWYTNTGYSLNNYFTFRNQWNQDTHWHIYQIATGITDQSLPKARKDLQELLNQLPTIKSHSPLSHRNSTKLRANHHEQDSPKT